jgi:hypothetical protein
MSYKIQHLKLGGILDQAIAITKDHFGVLFGILLFVWIPFQLVSGFVNLAVNPQLPPDPTSEDFIRFYQELLRSLPYTLPLSLVGIFVVLPLTNAAVIHAVARKYLGHNVTAAEAIQNGFQKIAPLVWTGILMVLAIMGGVVLFIVPGILFALWFGLAQHVVVLEGVSGVQALKRSKQLVRPYLGTFLMLGILLTIIGVMVGMVGALVPGRHVQMVVLVVLQAAVTLLSTATFVVFYFSCRCGVENFDLEHLAAAVGERGVPPANDTSPFAE